MRMRWLGLLARLVVGGVWVYAGAVKLPHLEASVTAVRAYQLLPTGVAELVGTILPILEVAVGALLIVGLFSRWAAVVSGLLLIGFIIGIASVWARGIAINCGCFGDGGYDPEAFEKYPYEIARDVGLLLASAFVAWRARTALALDSVLFPGSSRDFEKVAHVQEAS